MGAVDEALDAAWRYHVLGEGTADRLVDLRGRLGTARGVRPRERELMEYADHRRRCPAWRGKPCACGFADVVARSVEASQGG